MNPDQQQQIVDPAAQQAAQQQALAALMQRFPSQEAAVQEIQRLGAAQAQMEEQLRTINAQLQAQQQQQLEAGVNAAINNHQNRLPGAQQAPGNPQQAAVLQATIERLNAVELEVQRHRGEHVYNRNTLTQFGATMDQFGRALQNPGAGMGPAAGQRDSELTRMALELFGANQTGAGFPPAEANLKVVEGDRVWADLEKSIRAQMDEVHPRRRPWDQILRTIGQIFKYHRIQYPDLLSREDQNRLKTLVYLIWSTQCPIGSGSWCPELPVLQNVSFANYIRYVGNILHPEGSAPTYAAAFKNLRQTPNMTPEEYLTTSLEYWARSVNRSVTDLDALTLRSWLRDGVNGITNLQLKFNLLRECDNFNTMEEITSYTRRQQAAMSQLARAGDQSVTTAGLYFGDNWVGGQEDEEVHAVKMQDKSQIQCFNCQEIGHFMRECRKPRRQDPPRYITGPNTPGITGRGRAERWREGESRRFKNTREVHQAEEVEPEEEREEVHQVDVTGRESFLAPKGADWQL